MSVVRGVLSPERAAAMSSRGRAEIDMAGGQDYSAVAMSLVFHSGHPFVPTLRADVRLFEVRSPCLRCALPRRSVPAPKPLYPLQSAVAPLTFGKPLVKNVLTFDQCKAPEMIRWLGTLGDVRILGSYPTFPVLLLISWSACLAKSTWVSTVTTRKGSFLPAHARPGPNAQPQPNAQPAPISQHSSVALHYCARPRLLCNTARVASWPPVCVPAARRRVLQQTRHLDRLGQLGEFENSADVSVQGAVLSCGATAVARTATATRRPCAAERSSRHKPQRNLSLIHI